MIEVVLFDWGGTLSDVSGQPAALHEGARRVTEILFGRADPALAQALALAAMDAESRSAADPSHREVDLRNLLNTWATTQGMIPEVHRLDEAIEAIGACWVGRALGPIPGALDTLAWLRERGLRLGLVSNVWLPPRFCRQELTRQGLEPRLDFAVFSSQVGYRKPSPAIYEAALKEAFP
ncbi:MAG TPA: HAD family hydrolase, partial [Phycisphaerae bacterium]|nr:HAD family hydrolase [Phycisphaerae bacterium]